MNGQHDYGDIILQKLAEMSIVPQNVEPPLDIVSNLNKSASQIENFEIKELMKTAASTITDLKVRLSEAETQLAAIKKEARVNSIIQKMIDNGTLDSSYYEEKTAELMGLDQLDIIEKAVDLKVNEADTNLFDKNNNYKQAGMEKLSVLERLKINIGNI